MQPAIIATCIRAGHGRNLNCLPLRKLQCAAVLTLSWSLVVVVGAACCCCIPLRLVLYAGPELCILHTDLCTLCLRLLSLAATYGGCVSPSAIATDAPLAHVVVSHIATCAGGVFLSPTGADTVLVLGQLALHDGGVNKYRICSNFSSPQILVICQRRMR